MFRGLIRLACKLSIFFRPFGLNHFSFSFPRFAPWLYSAPIRGTIWPDAALQLLRTRRVFPKWKNCCPRGEMGEIGEVVQGEGQ